MRVLIASKNAGKIEGAKRTFERYFENVEIEGIGVESGVGDEPVNGDIMIGVKNRIKNLKEYAMKNNIHADYFLAIESGITNSLGFWMITNICAIEDSNGKISFGTSPSFPVPDRYVKDIIDTDLNTVIGNIYYKDDERHNGGGTIKLLTHDVVSRIDLTDTAFTMAITMHINNDTWS